MNELGYVQLSTPNGSLNLVLRQGGNYQEHLIRYFYYLGQGFHCISFLDSISYNNENRGSHPNHTITFKDFMRSMTNNMKKRASKYAHLWETIVKKVKIIYIFHMLSYDCAKMNIL